MLNGILEAMPLAWFGGEASSVPSRLGGSVSFVNKCAVGPSPSLSIRYIQAPSAADPPTAERIYGQHTEGCCVVGIRLLIVRIRLSIVGIRLSIVGIRLSIVGIRLSIVGIPR